MATGDVTVFHEFLDDVKAGTHSLASDTWKLGIINNSATVPAASTATPRWADFSSNQVAFTGNYNDGGETLAGVTCLESAGVMTFDANNVTVLQSASSGFTDGYWGILYDSTDASSRAMAYVEMGGAVSEQAGDVTFEWSSSGIITFSVNV